MLKFDAIIIPKGIFYTKFNILIVIFIVILKLVKDIFYLFLFKYLLAKSCIPYSKAIFIHRLLLNRRETQVLANKFFGLKLSAEADTCCVRDSLSISFSNRNSLISLSISSNDE